MTTTNYSIEKQVEKQLARTESGYTCKVAAVTEIGESRYIVVVDCEPTYKAALRPIRRVLVWNVIINNPEASLIAGGFCAKVETIVNHLN